MVQWGGGGLAFGRYGVHPATCDVAPVMPKLVVLVRQLAGHGSYSYSMAELVQTFDANVKEQTEPLKP